MDPIYLVVTLALTIIVYYTCLINADADPDTHDPDEANGHGDAGHHGEAEPSHGH